MKKSILLNILFCLTITLSAQSLLDIYQKGTVKLVPDNTYAQNNDWDEIFTVSPKSIIVRPDGQLVVNYPSKNYYSLFDQNGKFVKQFGINNSSGKRIQKIEAIEAINGNNYITGADNMGNMYYADFDGNYVKSLKLNYMVNYIVPMNNNLIAVSAWVLYKNTSKDFVAIIDCNTNEEKIIWKNTRDVAAERGITLEIPKGKNESNMEALSYHIISLASAKPATNNNSYPFIFFINNCLIVADPKDGEIMTYNTSGKLLSKEMIEHEQKFISVEEQKTYLKKIISQMDNSYINIGQDITEAEEKEIRMQLVKQMEAQINDKKEPIKIPAFATVIKDSDDNLLIFEMPEETGGNKFNVWIFK
ncbi:hypothetical protein LJC73_06200, partial [Bacteroidales bacterium OttesenSCG-928-L14]|nr:hypothetical protein [Bacteroidales bacterium OttesenSCG-928-L14]